MVLDWFLRAFADLFKKFLANLKDFIQIVNIERQVEDHLRSLKPIYLILNRALIL